MHVYMTGIMSVWLCEWVCVWLWNWKRVGNQDWDVVLVWAWIRVLPSLYSITLHLISFHPWEEDETTCPYQPHRVTMGRNTCKHAREKCNVTSMWRMVLSPRTARGAGAGNYWSERWGRENRDWKESEDLETQAWLKLQCKFCAWVGALNSKVRKAFCVDPGSHTLAAWLPRCWPDFRS